MASSPIAREQSELDAGQLNLILYALTANLFVHHTATTMLGPLLVELARAFDVSIAVVGQLAAATALSWALTGLVAGPLSDRFGRRPLLLGGGVVFAAATFLGGFAWSFGSLLVFRLLAGIGGSTVGPNSTSIVADNFPPNRRGRALGLMMTGQSFSQLFALPLVAVVADLAGWQSTFWLVAIVYAVLLAVLAFVLPVQPPVSPKRQTFLGGYQEVLSEPQVLVLLGTNVMARIVFGALTVYLTAFVVETYRLSLVAVAPVLAFAAVGTLLGAVVGGRLFDHMSKRSLAELTLVTQALFVLPLFFWTPSVWVTAIFAGLFSLSNSATRPVFIGMLAGVSERSRGTVMGLTALTNQTGVIVGSAIGGLLLAFSGFGAIGVFSAASSFLGAIAVRLYLAEPKLR
ncbi:MAG: MFS transporter [Chloroflexi bacterium]|nr:MFS transporter [Chloroflexota bacterium]